MSLRLYPTDFLSQLKVSDTKVVLKHKAEVEGVVPVIKTKLSLEAVVGTYGRVFRCNKTKNNTEFGDLVICFE